MKIAIFGLTISSSWGNGHATLWRGLCKALARAGHTLVFFERDAPWYAGARDCDAPEGVELILYPQWSAVAAHAARVLAGCDAAIVTSYCDDALAAAAAIHDAARPRAVFYDLDTPVTLARCLDGETPPWLDARGLRDYDLVLSYTGGGALTALGERLGARQVLPLYGHVDPDIHRPVTAVDRYRARLSYLGTYAADRQPALETLFVQAARARPQLRFLIGGAQYPDDFPWTPNVYFVRHLPPSEHAAFFSSSALTLNVTRAPMARMGWCPSGRLFEAAACGAAILSDRWEGMESFYTDGSEILLASETAEVLEALDRDDAELARLGRQARERTLTEHSSARRAAELVAALESGRRHLSADRRLSTIAQEGLCGA
jgi:spore maturation protein CgeB